MGLNDGLTLSRSHATSGTPIGGGEEPPFFFCKTSGGPAPDWREMAGLLPGLDLD